MTDQKIYVESNMIHIASTGIFINTNQGFLPISFIAADNKGIYTSLSCQYEPWHDDDWQCASCFGWNPRYEKKCVRLYCRKPKPNFAKRWKDAQ